MNTELAWGLILILLGLSIVIKIIFGVAIPVLRLVAGGVLIYIGFSMIFEIKQKKHYQPLRIHSKKVQEEAIIFQSKTIDLQSFEPEEYTQKAITVICGSLDLKLNPDIPTQLIINSVASHVKLPDNSIVPFGSYTYLTHESESPLLLITLRTVTGSTSISL